MTYVPWFSEFAIHSQHLDQTSYSNLDGCTLPSTAVMDMSCVGVGGGEHHYENLNTTTSYCNSTYYVDHVP